MYHSISFTNTNTENPTTRNTWDNWHLIPSSRPVVNPPSVVEKFIEIPGRNGFLDLTELLTGKPVYGARKGSWEFYVMHDEWSSWVNAYTSIMTFLHGKRMQIVLEDDPVYNYFGRIRVSAWNSNKDYSTIVFDYTIDPYKQHVEDGTADSGKLRF